MKKNVTNFVLNLHRRVTSFYRTNEGGRTIRNTRSKKFRKTSKKLIILAQIVAIWYLMILTGSYLTSDTGAYFNDTEKINGTISVSEDFCEGVEKGSDFWHKYCKDNSGIGGPGPDSPDVNTGKHTDPDNPGQNKGGCDDHTNAPCSEGKEIKDTDSSATNTDTDKKVPDKETSSNATNTDTDKKVPDKETSSNATNTETDKKVPGKETNSSPTNTETDKKAPDKETSSSATNTETDKKIPDNDIDLNGNNNGNSPK